MIIYIIAITLSMICAAYGHSAKGITQLKSTYRTLCVLTFIPMTFVSVFRYQVGTDWPIYHDYFHWIAQGTDKFTEPLFNLLNRVIYIFTNDSWWLFAICAFLICYFTFRAFMEQSVNPAFSILIFVLSGDYFNSQNQIRQALAMAIFLYAMKYMKERNWIKYFFFIIIATLIHTSAIVYAPLYFLYGRKVNAKLLGTIYAGTVVLLPIMNKVLVYIVSKTKYNWYFQSGYNMNDFYLLGFLVTSFYLVLFLFYYYYGQKHSREVAALETKKTGEVKEATEDFEYNVMTYTYFFAALSVLFSSTIPQMVRITTALSYVTSLLVPKLVMREHKRNRRIVLYMLVVFVFGVKLLYDVYHNGWYDATPYQWVFFR